MVVEKTISLDKADRDALSRVSYILRAINDNQLYGIKDLTDIANGNYSYGNIKIELIKEGTK